jgi:serine/threonine protein kinase
MAITTNLDIPPKRMVDDRYEIVSKVGEGGMAAVFSALDCEKNERIALKVFKQPYKNMDEQLIERLIREVNLCRKVRHKNVIRLYEVGIYEGHYFICMELLEGVSLAEIVAEPMELLRGLDYLVQMSEGLHAAHEEGVVHRDIKPANIFVTKEDVIKIMDFGMAVSNDSRRVTIQGNICGTPGFMAPEQIDEAPFVTHMADLYSLGLVAYKMFTGHMPFVFDSMITAMIANLEKTPASPSEFNPELPDEIVKIILRLLEKEPQKRFASCKELAEQVRQFISK